MCHAKLITNTYLSLLDLLHLAVLLPSAALCTPPSQSDGAKPLLSSSSTPTTTKPEAVTRTSATAKVSTGRVKSSVSRKSGSGGTTLPPTERTKRTSNHSVTKHPMLLEPSKIVCDVSHRMNPGITHPNPRYTCAVAGTKRSTFRNQYDNQGRW